VARCLASIDFEAIAASKSPRDSDRLLLKLGAAMQGPPAEPSSGGRSEGAEEEGTATPGTETEAAAADGVVSLEISAAEAREMAGALAKLEQLQAWPKDVLRMSRALRSRLASVGGE